MPKKPIAIACADLHLTLTPPPCRVGETNWLGTQAWYLAELDHLANNIHHQIPILCAGDIFDRWNAPAELINFAIKYMPVMWAVPGQHDLANHNLDDIHRSAYWTMKEAGKINHLRSGCPRTLRNKTVTGFAWEVPLESCTRLPNKGMSIALVHRYVCQRGADYPGAPKEAYVNKKFWDSLAGFDIIITGDNHKPFEASCGNQRLFNCGSFMRRRSDQLDYKPSVGIIYNDGTIERHYLDISRDVFEATADEPVVTSTDMQGLIDELQSVGEGSLDFEASVREWIKQNPTRKAAAKALMKAMGI